MKKNQKRTQARPKRRRYVLGRYRRSAGLVSIVFVFLVGILLINAINLQKKKDAYKQQQEELQTQIEEQKQRAEEIKELKGYVQTEQFEKEIAEEKLGLVDPDEIIFKPVK